MGGWLGDLKVSVRQLAKAPGFTVAAIVVLALGIGLNAGMFSLVYAFGFMGRPFAAPAQVLQLYSSKASQPDSYRAFSYPAYLELASSSDIFSGVLAHSPAIVGIGDGSEARRGMSFLVSRNYFDVLGVPIIRGRGFTEEESKPGQDVTVAVATWNYWQRTGFDPDLLGKTVRINERPFTIVGITPQGFTGTMMVFGPEFFLPLGVFHSISQDFLGGQGRSLDRADAYSLFLVARLRSDVAAGTLEERLKVPAGRLEAAMPAEYDDARVTAGALPRLGTSTSPMNESVLPLLGALMLALTGAVLLTVCLNLAGMLMARGSARRKEFAVRLALGGGRFRIVRQLLTEGLILSLGGGVIGVALGLYGVNTLTDAFASMLPITLVLDGVRGAALGVATVVFCTLATIWFALGPALRHSRTDVLSDLKQHAGEDAVRRRRFMPRNPLVVAQVALSLSLLIAAGLFVRMAQTALTADLGYKADHTVLAEVDGKLAGMSTPQILDLYASIDRRLSALPGVQSSSVGAIVPLGMINSGRAVRRGGIHVPPDAKPETPELGRSFNAPWNAVSGKYFDSMGIPLLQGRTFTESESFQQGGPPVAILDEVLARKLWPDGSALGQRVQFVRDEEENVKGISYEVIGIVGATRRDMFDKELPGGVFEPFGQRSMGNAYFHVRPASASSTLAEDVRREIKEAAPSLPLFSSRTFEAHTSTAIEYWALKLAAGLFGLFGGLAMLVALVGIYGVMSYAVARRTREIGIRMAVGAMPQAVRRMILGESLSMTLMGIAAGLVLGVGVGRLLASVFVDVSAFDVVVFTAVPGTFMLAAFAAAWLPARRATLINPVTALRSE